MTNIVSVTSDNLDREHICCSLSDAKGESGVACKKAWLRDRFKDGLTFRKLGVRGKVFLESIPAEKAWLPLDAPGFMHIHCFWVSGQYKGRGHANALLTDCIAHARAQGCIGLTALSSFKKRPFLSDGGYLRHKGFQLADEAAPYFQLLYLPLTGTAVTPKFSLKQPESMVSGTVLYYSHQCPFAEKYAFLFRDAAERRGVPFSFCKLETVEQARGAPTPATSYSLFHNGAFVTHEILSEKKIEAFLDNLGDNPSDQRY